MFLITTSRKEDTEPLVQNRLPTYPAYFGNTWTLTTKLDIDNFVVNVNAGPRFLGFVARTLLGTPKNIAMHRTNHQS
eukprot:3906810-Rhodomonas_salina.1